MLQSHCFPLQHLAWGSIASKKKWDSRTKLMMESFGSKVYVKEAISPVTLHQVWSPLFSHLNMQTLPAVSVWRYQPTRCCQAGGQILQWILHCSAWKIKKMKVRGRLLQDLTSYLGLSYCRKFSCRVAETDTTQRKERTESALPNIALAKCAERVVVVIQRSFVWSQTLAVLPCSTWRPLQM